MTYKPDWADRIADATSKWRSKSSWEYEHPNCAWESMPWFVRWPLAVAFGLWFVGMLLIPLGLMVK